MKTKEFEWWEGDINLGKNLLFEDIHLNSWI